MKNMAEIPGIELSCSGKEVFLKKLRTVWAKHPQFDASNTILVDDCRYKSLKNNYENCLAIRSYEPKVDVPHSPGYMMTRILPWLFGWLKDPYPSAYTRKNPLFDIEDDISMFIANHFIAMEGYSYSFAPPHPDI